MLRFELAAELPVPYLVDHWGVNAETITKRGCTVEIEIGVVRPEAAAVAAEQRARTFLRRVDALPGKQSATGPDFLHMAEPLSKPAGDSYEVCVENSGYVPEGTVYASVDRCDLVADDACYPILVSAHGYPDVFVFKGHVIGGSFEDVTETVLRD